MMLRLYRWTILTLLVAVVGCAFALRGGTPPTVVVLEAQTFPATLYAEWTPNAASDNVVNYTFTLGTNPSVTVPPTVDVTCSCVKQAFTVPASGNYSATIVANNQMVSTDPASLQSSPPTTILFIVNKAGNAPGGGVIKQH